MPIALTREEGRRCERKARAGLVWPERGERHRDLAIGPSCGVAWWAFGEVSAGAAAVSWIKLE